MSKKNTGRWEPSLMVGVCVRDVEERVLVVSLDRSGYMEGLPGEGKKQGDSWI